MQPSRDVDLCDLLDHASVSESDVLLALRQLEVRRMEELCIVSQGWDAWLQREGDGMGACSAVFLVLDPRTPFTPLLGVKALFTRFQ